MNKHFSDARYYLGRAASHLKIGLSEELAPVVGQVQSRLGQDVEEAPEPETRAGRVRVAATQSTARLKQATRRVRTSGQSDESTA